MKPWLNKVKRDSSVDNTQQRRVELESELQRYVATLSGDPTVRKVLVFGSMAGNEALATTSDIDLVVIQETDVPFWPRMKRMRRRLRPRVATDLLVYREDEWAELQRTRPFVRDELAGHGKIVYER